jgi:type VI secretion system protein ImpE
LRSVTLEAPEDLRDLVWSPAQLIFGDGGGVVAMIPTRYPGSESAEDGFKMARRTEWREGEGGAYLGLGQRMLATDLGEHPLLDIRHLEFASASVDSASGADADG